MQVGDRTAANETAGGRVVSYWTRSGRARTFCTCWPVAVASLILTNCD